MSYDQRTASDVAMMENELTILRGDLRDKEVRLALVTQERDSLKIELALKSQAVSEAQRRATEIETIMRQTSAGLLAGLNKMQSDREIEREARRRQQEHALAAEDKRPAPTFLRRTTSVRDETTYAAGGGERGEREERSAPVLTTRRPTPPGLGGDVKDHPLLPRSDFIDEDQENLRQLARNHGSLVGHESCNSD